MARILVTGADGFTGRFLCKELSSVGHSVVGAVRDGSGVSLDGVTELVSLELSDSDSINRVFASCTFDYIVHLAAISFVGHDEPLAFYQVNTLGTLGLLEAVAQADWVPVKVIVASSANVYGRNARACVSEEICPSPVNHYGASKLAMENLALEYADRYPLVIVRPFNYTGVGQDNHFVIPKIVDHFRRGARGIELGNLHVHREFNDVRWVAQVYRELLEAETTSAPVNLCSGQVHSLREVLAIMAELAGYEIEVRVNPKFVRASELPELRGDPIRLTGMLGLIEPIELRETLAWMYGA